MQNLSPGNSAILVPATVRYKFRIISGFCVSSAFDARPEIQWTATFRTMDEMQKMSEVPM